MWLVALSGGLQDGFFSCEVGFVSTEHGQLVGLDIFLFQNWLIWTVQKFLIAPKIIVYFPLQVVIFVLCATYIVCASLSVSLYDCFLAHMSVLKKYIIYDRVGIKWNPHTFENDFHWLPWNCWLIFVVPIVCCFSDSSLECTSLGKYLFQHFTNSSGLHHPPRASLVVYWSSSELLDTVGIPDLDCVLKTAIYRTEHTVGFWS